MEEKDIRLQKYFTDCGVLSRRAAEAEIAAGRVTVNGAIATTGQKINPEADVVLYRGKRVTKKNAPHRYLLLNKPRGFVTTLSDEKGRRTVADLVRDVGTRLYPVGRLDMDSEGLLILTDDGALTQRLTHPRHHIPKTYHVTVTGLATKEQLARLRAPFLMDGYTTHPADVTLLEGGAGESILCVVLYEGRNRQIRRMCEEVGLSIRRLVRVAIGNISLGDLKTGTHRPLTDDEVAYLKGSEKA